MQDNIFKSTMTNGLIMGVLFFVNFLLSGSRILPLVFLSYLMIALIIVLMHRMAKRYRDVDCGGTIKYWKVFNYVVLTFLFAAIISSVFKIVYLQYINTEYLPALFEERGQMEQNHSLSKSSTYRLTKIIFLQLKNNASCHLFSSNHMGQCIPEILIDFRWHAQERKSILRMTACPIIKINEHNYYLLRTNTKHFLE